MPIVDPNGFDALDLFPLQINPHFTNALPEGHKGETREQRIRETAGGSRRN
ncbi:peptidase E [Salmonella enterica subsp. enterica]|uniref:Peptidase E n=1 Tax=Salmonella enterica I TaxID=59201 RepID=A0A447TQ14_SALET|nr:peptidase E [Salmonella enterica subsp. enterica]